MLRGDLDPRILEDPRTAREALRMILKTKQELDDFIDTLELLSNPRFKRLLNKGLKEAQEGKTVMLSMAELKKKLK